MSSQVNDARQDFDRLWRVIDLSLTAHSTLADRYRRRETALIVSVMTLSAATAGFAFVSDDPRIELLGISGRRSAWLGTMAVAVLALEIIQLTVRWADRSGMHRDAARTLATMKTELRNVKDESLEDKPLIEGLQLRLTTELSRLHPIPENQFLRLKARHKRKIALSKAIDKNEGAPVSLLRLRLLIRSLKTRP